MESRRVALCALAGSVLAVATPQTAVAQAQRGHNLAGHEFVPSSVVQHPFATRHYGMATGFGAAFFPLGEEDLTLAFFGLDLRTQQPILGPVSLTARMSGVVLVGASEAAALQFGADASIGGAGGIAVNAYQDDRLSLSFALDVGGGRSFKLNPNSAIERSLAVNSVDAGPLFDTLEYREVRAGARFGVGAVSIFGAFTELEYSWNRFTVAGEDKDQHRFGAGLGLSLNFDSLSAPIGLLMAYRRNQSLVEDGRGTDIANVGLFFVDGERFAMGLEAEGQFQELTGGDRLIVVSGRFVMRYWHASR